MKLVVVNEVNELVREVQSLATKINQKQYHQEDSGALLKQLTLRWLSVNQTQLSNTSDEAIAHDIIPSSTSPMSLSERDTTPGGLEPSVGNDLEAYQQLFLLESVSSLRQTVEAIMSFQITYNELIMSIGSIFEVVRKHHIEEEKCKAHERLITNSIQLARFFKTVCKEEKPDLLGQLLYSKRICQIKEL